MNPVALAGASAATVIGPLVALVLGLTGCAAPTDCGPGLARARDAGRHQLPLEQFIDSVPAQCRARAEQTWAEILRADCEPLYGFHAGRTSRPVPPACHGEAFDSAWNLGRMLADLERERAELEVELATGRITPDRRTEIRRRIVAIERDLPEIRALARMEGYLPPARAPERSGFELPWQ
ncbi:MAG: hypothetical protein RQ847_06030 [Wenzhouxiangellaceae bacterium]|nr:hypothetical protein [Wenzhouxiangellaceae bacterium]